jgi:hypothetical protein
MNVLLTSLLIQKDKIQQGKIKGIVFSVQGNYNAFQTFEIKFPN